MCFSLIVLTEYGYKLSKDEMEKIMRKLKVVGIVILLLIIAAIVYNQIQPSEDFDFTAMFNAVPSRMIDWDQDDSHTRELLERFSRGL